MKKIELPGSTQCRHEVGMWIISNMQFNMPLSAICALNEMKNAASILRDHPDVFRHGLKQHTNTAIRKGDIRRTTIAVYHSDRLAFEEYADKIVDATEEDIACLRAMIQKAAELERVKTPDLVAWVETAHLLLQIAVRHYHEIIIKGNRKANVGLSARKWIDYGEYFTEFRMDDVLDAWALVASGINPKPQILKQEHILKQSNIIYEHYKDGTYINQCIDGMRHHPFYATMEAEPDNDESVNNC